MQEDLFSKYNDVKERLDSALKNGSISQKDFNDLSSELSILFPYLNYALHREINLSRDVLKQKIDDIFIKFRKIVLNSRSR